MIAQIMFAAYVDFVMLVAYGYAPLVVAYNRVAIELEALHE